MSTALFLLSFVLIYPAGPSTPARVAVVLNAGASINALEATIKLPPGVKPLAVSDEGSLVSYWLTEPSYDATQGGISFAGVIPGGWQGKGELFEFDVPAGAEGLLVFNDAHAYLNGPDAKEAPLSFSTLSLARGGRGPGALPYILVVVALLALLVWLRRHLRLTVV